MLAPPPNEPERLAASSTPLPSDAAEIERLRAALRRTLVESEAARALNASGCTSARLLTPHIAAQLTAVDIGEPDCVVRVFAVDENGTVRTGPRGSMTADDVVAEWRANNPVENRTHWR